MSRLIRLLLTFVLVAVLVPVLFSQPAAAADVGAKTNLSPLIPTVGTPVSLGGTGPGGGWAAGEAITIWLASTTGERDWTSPRDSGDIVATAVANDTGNWGASFILPDRKTGKHEIYVQGSTNFAIFSQTFPAARTKYPVGAVLTTTSTIDVKPWMDRSPSSGAPGTTVTLKGSGFGGNETGITVNFGAAPEPGPFLKVVASGITATSRGAWSATFIAPDGAAMRYGLQVGGDATANFVPQAFEIVQSAKLTPASGPMGSSITFIGGGFTGTTVTVYLDTTSTTLETSPVTLTVGATGIVSGVAKIPSDGLTDGPHEIIIRDNTGKTSTATFTVSKRVATLELAPSSGIGAITITGRYFTQGSPVDIFFDGKKVPAFSGGGGDIVLTTGPSQSAGFTAIVSVPTMKAGKYEVKAVDVAGISGTASFEVPNLGAPGATVPGAPSAAGPAGPPGPAGPAGKAGEAGKAGPAGKAGDAGKAGAAGPAGPAGKAGDAGKAGATGPAGAAGAAGAPGAPANMLIVWIALIIAVIAIIVAIIPMTQKKKA